MEEVWKDVKGYEGFYQVSNTGYIRSLDRVIPHSHGSGNRVLMGRILMAHPNPKGYLHAVLSVRCKTLTIRVHRIVAETFIPNPLNLPEVNHIDENKQNNSASNLEWTSHIDNIRYGTGMARSAKSRIGRQNTRGEQIGTSKLKEPQVIEIFKSRKLYTEISEKYNVGMACISRIKNKKTWKHILTNL